MDNLIGQQVRHYQVTALLGVGRLGPVYQAIDLEDRSRLVALKTVSIQLARQPEFRQRFLEEVQAIPRMDHPSVVKIYEAGIDTQRDILYIAMEDVPDKSLTGYLQQLAFRGEQIRVSEALHIVAQVAEALGYVHQKGVVHRDIRPNIILFRRDEQAPEIGGIRRRAVFSGDFGLATLLAEKTEPFQQLWPYMSPEQCLGKELDGRSDLYSLGILLYQLVAGQLPFNITTLEEALRQHPFQDPPPPRQIRPELPAVVEKVLLRAIAKRPEDRYQSGTDMAEALRETVGQLPAALAAPTGQESIGGVETQVESAAEAALHEIKWSADEDWVTITQDMPYSLNRHVISIGRGENNDIVLTSTSVTRRHAQLERTTTGWQVRDLGSKNGTYLDGAPLLPDIPAQWNGSQTLRIGPYFLQLKPGQGDRYLPQPFNVIVNPNEIEVAPGTQRELQVAVTNQGKTKESFEIKIERLPSDWITIPQPMLSLQPGERITVPVLVHPPAASHLMPGKSRYLLVVTSQAIDQEKVAIPGVVQLTAATDEFALTLEPGTVKGKGTCELRIHNQSILEQRYTIIGRDPEDAILFGQWRSQAVTGSAAPSSRNGSKGGRKSAAKGKSFLKRLPVVRRMQYAPQRALQQALSVPRVALNRILPGLGSAVGTGKMGTGNIALPGKKGANGTPARSPAPAPARNGQFEKLVFPKGLYTQVTVPAGEVGEILVSLAPKKRPFLGREEQSLPFEIRVSTPGNERRSAAGQLNVRPRLRSRLSAGVIVLILLSLCLVGTLAYASLLNPTVAAVLLAPRDLDGDGLSNWEEVYIHKTNPNMADTDGDGVPDGEEIAAGLDPNNRDTDGDGLSDGRELALGTDPLSFDTDGDQLSDGVEVHTLGTDPLTPDTGFTWVQPTTTPPVATPVVSGVATAAPPAEPALAESPAESPLQLIFSSAAPYDGDINQAANLVTGDGDGLKIGDGPGSNEQFKAILSFNTSSIPSQAIIESVQLRLLRSDSAGVPGNLGQIHVDIAPAGGFSSSAALQASDFNAPAAVVNATTLSLAPGDGSWAEGYLNAAAMQALNRQGSTQFRLYFTLPNDGNGAEDWLLFHAGDAEDEDVRPQLVVVYRLR